MKNFKLENFNILMLCRCWKNLDTNEWKLSEEMVNAEKGNMMSNCLRIYQFKKNIQILMILYISSQILINQKNN